MSKTINSAPVSGIQIACFDLCQNIGMEIEEKGRRITAHGIHFPATHDQILADLKRIKLFSDHAITAIEKALTLYRSEHAPKGGGE